MISLETSAKIAAMDISDDLSASSKLREIKKVFELNNPCSVCEISDQDINFLNILEGMNMTQREMDLIYISQFYHACYVDYNITIKVQKESVSHVSVERLMKMYRILKKYNFLQFLLTDDGYLSERQFLNKIKK